MATKIKASNLHTDVKTMMQTMVDENAVDSADVSSIVNANIASKSTSDISEGTNLYYTDARVGTYISGDRTYGSITTTGDIALGDSVKAKFGTGSDLQIYHDGSNSYIQDGGSGNLRILVGDLQVRNYGSNENIITSTANAEVALYHNALQKLATTSTGIDVTGTVTADDIILSDANAPSITLTDTTNTVTTLIQSGNSSSTIGTTTSHGLNLVTNNADRMFIDASGNVGIGTGSPSDRLHVSGASSVFKQQNNVTSWTLGLDAADQSYKIKHNGSERMRIDSSGRVGLGTTAPSSPLTVNATSSSEGIRVQRNGVSSQYISIHQATGGDHVIETFGNKALNFGVRDAQPLTLKTNNQTRLTIDGSGNVGIGVSPSSGIQLKVGNSANNSAVSRVTNGTVSVDLTASGSGLAFLEVGTNHPLVFATNATERMRIDSSGNLLVGTTVYNGPGNASSGDYGVVLREEGILTAGANASESLILNRMNSDGDLATFKRSGTTIGSIGIEGGDVTIGKAASGLQFRAIDPCIRPHNMSTNSPSDNAVDLGRHNTRFKDLYLSGGVYLGGTGSANKLEDYEEGNFTPFMRINNGVQGITYNSRDGYYTKVGNLVTALVVINLSSKGTNVGGVSIDGLPFTVADSMSYTSFNGTCAPAYFSSMATNISTLTGWVAESTTEMYLRHTDGGGNSSIQNTTNGNINNNTDFRFLITYIST